MAELQLRQSETVLGRMPEVCMVCGEPATTHIRKNFAWHPPWVILLILVHILIYVVVALIMTKRQAVDVPVCDQHRAYWWKRYLLMWLPFVLIAAIAIGGAVLADATNNNDFIGVACAGGAIGGIVWLIVMIVINSRMLRPKEITDRTITLKRVDERFVEAFDERRRERDRDFDRDFDEGVEDYDERMRRRRQRRAAERTGYDEQRESRRASRDPDEPPDERIRPRRDE